MDGISVGNTGTGTQTLTYPLPGYEPEDFLVTEGEHKELCIREDKSPRFKAYCSFCLWSGRESRTPEAAMRDLLDHVRSEAHDGAVLRRAAEERDGISRDIARRYS